MLLSHSVFIFKKKLYFTPFNVLNYVFLTELE